MVTSAKSPECSLGAQERRPLLVPAAGGARHNETSSSPLHGGDQSLQLSREDYPGVWPLPFIIDHTQGVAVVFQGKSYLENLDYLRQMGAKFVVNNLKWPEGIARPLIQRSFGIQNITDLYCALRGLDPNRFQLNRTTIQNIIEESLLARLVPSVLAMRTIDMTPGDYGFISEQKMFFYHDREEGEIPVYYHGLRAGEEEFRGHGWGRLSIHLGFSTHREVKNPKARYFHKSSNPIAWHTNTQAKELRQETSHPWNSEYQRGTLDWRIARWLFDRVRLNGKQLERSGIIRGEYLVPNLGFDPDELRGGALEKWQKMTAPPYGIGPLDAVLSGYRVAA